MARESRYVTVSLTLKANFHPTTSSSLRATVSSPGGYSLALYRDQYDRTVSAIMYHQSTHWTGLELEDVVMPDGTEAHGWARTQRFDRTYDRLKNADGYMVLGLARAVRESGPDCKYRTAPNWTLWSKHRRAGSLPSRGKRLWHGYSREPLPHAHAAL